MLARHTGVLMTMAQIHTEVVQSLIEQINSQPGWKLAFVQAVSDSISQAPKIMENYGIRDLESYYDYMDSLQTWIPTENSTATQLLTRMRVFYFPFSQNSLRNLQTPIAPETGGVPLSWLSSWLAIYAAKLGDFMDTPESLTAESLKTFYACDKYQLDDYIVPDGGWKSFNHFFARHVKPDRRPIAAPEDPKVICSPADNILWGGWPIDENGIATFKGISWRISELLQDTSYSQCFSGGSFFHSILLPSSYHRMHSPVAGVVLECKIIPGQVREEAIAVDGILDHDPSHDEGFQWCLTRGLIVLDSPGVGKVAILPVGLGHVSSVVLTPHVGDTLAKGDEIGYFQYGGSDIVMVLQGMSKAIIPPAEDQDHPDLYYKVGEKIGTVSLQKEANFESLHISMHINPPPIG